MDWRQDAPNQVQLLEDVAASWIAVAGPGAFIPLKVAAASVMRCMGVGTRMSVYRAIDAMDVLGLVVYEKGKGVRLPDLGTE